MPTTWMRTPPLIKHFPTPTKYRALWGRGSEKGTHTQRSFRKLGDTNQKGLGPQVKSASRRNPGRGGAGGAGRGISKAASPATRPLTQIQALKFISTQPESSIAAEKWNSLCDP